MIQPYEFSDHYNKSIDRQFNYIINSYPEFQTHLNRNDIHNLVERGYRECQREYL